MQKGFAFFGLESVALNGGKFFVCGAPPQTPPPRSPVAYRTEARKTRRANRYAKIDAKESS